MKTLNKITIKAKKLKLIQNMNKNCNSISVILINAATTKCIVYPHGGSTGLPVSAEGNPPQSSVRKRAATECM